MPDLLIHLFDLYVERNYPPDVLSIEESIDENIIIKFEWFSGKLREFGYTKKRWNKILNHFNNYWNGVNNGNLPQKTFQETQTL